MKLFIVCLIPVMKIFASQLISFTVLWKRNTRLNLSLLFFNFAYDGLYHDEEEWLFRWCQRFFCENTKCFVENSAHLQIYSLASRVLVSVPIKQRAMTSLYKYWGVPLRISLVNINKCAET